MTADEGQHMLNRRLTRQQSRLRQGLGVGVMSFEVMLAGFIMAVGLAVAGAGTHLYQAFSKQQAMLRYDGSNVMAMFGHLVMSFVCGPYIMLQLGWRSEKDGTISIGSVLLSALIAFGWAFITGLLFLSIYFAIGR
jgi:cytochrome c biogenesis protein CcdA